MQESMADKFGYRGVEYSVIQLRDNKWKWAFYTKIEQGQRQKGEITGTRDQAEAACKAAIDAALDGKSEQ